jgi:hypothetical protein
MNDEERSEERLSGMLREAALHLTPRENRGEFVERVLMRGTDRLFTCDSLLGELYVGVSHSGVRLLGRAASPEEFAKRYRERFGRLLAWGTDETTRMMAERIAAAIAGEKVEVPTVLSGTTPFQRQVLEVVTAGCIDTDLPAGRGYSGESGKPLIEIAHVHHPMWVVFTETRCIQAFRFTFVDELAGLLCEPLGRAIEIRPELSGVAVAVGAGAVGNRGNHR